MRRLSTLVAVALATCLTLVALDSHAQGRITYAEAFAPLVSGEANAQKQSQGRRLQVRAFGQNFVLQLEENSRLAASLPADVKTRASDLTLFRGSVQGRDGSWVRLTLHNGSYEGAIWDGSELYGVDPRSALPADQYIGSSTTGASVIYRASDIANDTPLTCGVGDEPLSANVLQRYRALARELSVSAALAGAREIEVAMVADYEFYSLNGPNALTTMIARMNTVDGIFAAQLDVNIVPAEFTLFTTPADPFESRDASTLLQQFGAFRDSTPAVRNRGLAHLLTGRDLDGNTVGIAYRDTLCHPQAGVSVSQGAHTSAEHALIIAHEIGHNFGATHDGVTGVCETTPQSYLMSPTLNGSSTFSSCSLQAMQASAATAVCVTPARTRDIAVTVPASPLAAIVQQPFDYVVDVSSVGQGASFNVVATTSFSAQLQVISASMPGAECTTDLTGATCRLAALDAGQSRRMTVRLHPGFEGSFTSRASAVSSADRNPGNDSVDVPIQVNRSQAAAIVFDEPLMTAVIRTPFQIGANVTATGVDPLLNATAIIRGGGVQISSVSVDTGSCALQSGEWVCNLQTMAPQARRRITFQATAQTVGTSFPTIEIRSGNAPQVSIGSHFVNVAVAPQYDIAISTPGLRDLVVAVGAVAEYPLTIASVGTLAISNARVTLLADFDTHLEFVASGATCTPVARGLDCALGTLAPGTTLTGTVRASASTPLRTYIDVDVPQAVPDDDRSNSHYLLSLDVRVGTDVGTTIYTEAARIRDGVRLTAGFTTVSYGASFASNVRSTLTLPAGFVIHSAAMQNGECNVILSTATCRLPAMTSTYASMEVAYTAPEPGDFSGSFETTADGDAVAMNNSTPLLFTVIPNVDPKLVLPTGLRALVDETVDVKLDVVSGRYAVSSAQLQIDMNSFLSIVSAQTSSGACQSSSIQITCMLGALAADATTTVTLRARPNSKVLPTIALFARLIAADDLDLQNNQGQVVLNVDSPGDAILQLNTTSITATADRQVAVVMNVRSAGRTTDTFVEFSYDSTRVALPQVANVPLCTWTTSPARCPLGTLDEGATRQVLFSFTPSGSGPLSIRVRVVAANETKPTDNEGTLTLDVQPATIPAPTNGGTTGGGGGGGPMAPLFCVALACVALSRRLLAT